MQLQQAKNVYNSSDIFSDLPFKFRSNHSNYTIVAQDVNEIQNTINAPSVSMGPYLLKCGLVGLLPTISIYSRRGYNRAHMRLLYMNATALEIWKAMGRRPRQIGEQHRPPHTAVLCYGMPFSE